MQKIFKGCDFVISALARAVTVCLSCRCLPAPSQHDDRLASTYVFVILIMMSLFFVARPDAGQVRVDDFSSH